MTATDLSFGSSATTLASPHLSDHTFIDGAAPLSSSIDNDAFLLPDPQTPDLYRGPETPASARYSLSKSKQQRNRENHLLDEDHLMYEFDPISDIPFGGFGLGGGLDDGFQFGGDNMLGLLDLGDMDLGLLGPEAFGDGELLLADGLGLGAADLADTANGHFGMNLGGEME